jgi:poly(hydroxyalkanoate) depolymerase family esterase
MLHCSNEPSLAALCRAAVAPPTAMKEPGMRPLSDTLSRLARLRATAVQPDAATGSDRLTDLTDFGANPGALRARFYRPVDLPPGAPLVVVLHGCTQTAAGYDRGSGWSELADQHGFALLFPEQQRANNANLCFNWFVPEDVRRDGGEAMSIRQMVEHVAVRHHIDRDRVFVTGLSAGGAMTAALLAAYPETFAGGAVIAGLPYGVATTVPEAFDRMRGQGVGTDTQLQALARSASRHDGPWPTLSVWHGSADQTVVPSNAEAIIAQWRGLHGAGTAPTLIETIDGHRRRVWRDRDGRDVIESFMIAGMAHGTPIDPAAADGVGAAAPYMLDAGISSTHHIARFWGIDGGGADQRPAPVDRSVPMTLEHDVASDGQHARPGAADEPMRGILLSKASPNRTAATGVQKVIEDALRAAGLMK